MKEFSKMRGVALVFVAMLLGLAACSDTSGGNTPVGDGDTENIIACFSEENCPDGMTCDLEANICRLEAGDLDEEEAKEADPDPVELDEEEALPEADEDEAEPDEIEIEEEEAPPEPSIAFTAPENGVVVDETVLLQAVVEHMEIADVAFKIGDRQLSVMQEEPWEYQWDTSVETEGTVVVEALARSTSLDVVKDEREIVIDHSAPVVAIVSPDPQDPAPVYHYGERVEVELSVEDGSRLKRIDVVLDFQSLEPVEVSSTQSHPVLDLFGVDDLSPGNHKLTLTGVDVLGREDAEPDELQFEVDADGPEVQLMGVDSMAQVGSACVEDTDCGDNQICATLTEYCGNEFAGGYCLPLLPVDEPFGIDVVDPSGLGTFSLSAFRVGSETVLAGTDVEEELPLEIEQFDAILTGEKYYPLYLEIHVVGEDDEHGPEDRMGNASMPYCAVVAVDRLKWRYDSGIVPEESFVDFQAPAASQDERIYVPLYDTLAALDPAGDVQWSCQGESGISAGPMVSQGDETQPTAILWGDEDGKAWIRLENEGAECIASESVAAGRRFVGSPLLISRENVGNGFTIRAIYAGIYSSGFEIYMGTYIYDAIQPANSGWTMEKKFETSGAFTAVPMAYDVSRNRLWVATKSILYRLVPETGGIAGQDLFSSTPDSQFRGGFGIDSYEGIVYYTSVTKVHLYQTNFQRFTPFALNGHILNKAQPIPTPAQNDHPRKIFVSGTEYVSGGTTPYLIALEAPNSLYPDQIPQELFRIQTPGEVIGSPALSAEDRLYAGTGLSPRGVIQAIDIYPQDIASARDRWRYKVEGEHAAPGRILAPVLLTPWGDLIAVSSDMRVYSMVVEASGPNASMEWNQHQGNAARTGRFNEN